MNYQNHYDKLISRARNRKLDCYTESHHIIPRCMNGTDDKDNLVDLTAREHFIAHLLLMKIYPKSYGLIKAVNMMCVTSGNQVRSMNRMYGWLKEKYSFAKSLEQKGENNSQFGTTLIHNKFLQIDKRVKIIEVENYLINGWENGSLKFVCERCGKTFSEFMRNIHLKSCEKKEPLVILQQKKEIKKQQSILEYNEKIKNKKENLLPILEDYKSYGFNFVCEKYDYQKTEGALYSLLKYTFGDFRKSKKRVEKEYICKTCGCIFLKSSSKKDKFMFCSRECCGKYNFKNVS